MVSPFGVVLLYLQRTTQDESLRRNLAARAGGLTLCLSMISFAMHAGGPDSRKGVPIRRAQPEVGAEPRGEGAEGLTRRDNREASFVHVELISAGDGCPDGGEAEAA